MGANTENSTARTTKKNLSKRKINTLTRSAAIKLVYRHRYGEFSVLELLFVGRTVDRPVAKNPNTT